MSLTIHRLNLEVTDQQYVALRGTALSVGPDYEMRPDRFNLWYEADPDLADPPERSIVVLGTGHPAPWSKWTRHAYRFLGTVIYPAQPLVWHVFAGPF